jgi:hypothetical protein
MSIQCTQSIPSRNLTHFEIVAICNYFGVQYTNETFSLGQCYNLEGASVEHPSGDSLETLANGYKVAFVGDSMRQAPYYFQRNTAGLNAALELLTALF